MIHYDLFQQFLQISLTKLPCPISDIKQCTLEKSFNNVFTIKIFFSYQLCKEISFQSSSFL